MPQPVCQDPFPRCDRDQVRCRWPLSTPPLHRMADAVRRILCSPLAAPLHLIQQRGLGAEVEDVQAAVGVSAGDEEILGCGAAAGVQAGLDPDRSAAILPATGGLAGGR